MPVHGRPPPSSNRKLAHADSSQENMLQEVLLAAPSTCFGLSLQNATPVNNLLFMAWLEFLY